MAAVSCRRIVVNGRVITASDVDGETGRLVLPDGTRVHMRSRGGWTVRWNGGQQRARMMDGSVCTRTAGGGVTVEMVGGVHTHDVVVRV